MIGHVASLHALLSIPFRAAGQPDITIEFVVDTGFAGFLTLPPAAISTLKLPLIRAIPASLADDSSVLVFVHMATILWNGDELEVEVIALGRRPLLGTLLLNGHDLSIQFSEDGLVTIDRV